MRWPSRTTVAIAWLAMAVLPCAAEPGAARLKDLGHFLGWNDTALVGYGIVTGLAGSGDSPNSAATRRALSNVLGRLGSNVPPDDLRSRNVATVIVTASLPPASSVGDKVDVVVTSVGDARSLVGGVLLMTPLLGPDKHAYALAQGSLVVGGYNFQDHFNIRQKNYPTTGVIANGGMVETTVDSRLTGADGRLTFVLKDPDFGTAQRIADALNAIQGPRLALAVNAHTVLIDSVRTGDDVNRFISRIENVTVSPEEAARVVVNERSGTIVAGGSVKISPVVIAQGDIKVSVDADTELAGAPYYGNTRHDGPELLVTNSKLEVTDARRDAVVTFPNTTVADLVQALTKAKVNTRGMIAILQAIKAAGALHADIIVQ